MKLRCDRDTLLDGLAVVSRAVASRGDGRMALSGVKFTLAGDELALTGTDLDLTITVKVAVSGQGDGEALPPGRLATDIVRSLDPGTVEMTVDEDRVHIVSGRSHFSVQALPVDQFPRPPKPEGPRSTSSRRRSLRPSARWPEPPGSTTPNPSCGASTSRLRATASGWWPWTATAWPSATCRASTCSTRASRSSCRLGR